jgi:hypothetical protein
MPLEVGGSPASLASISFATRSFLGDLASGAGSGSTAATVLGPGAEVLAQQAEVAKAQLAQEAQEAELARAQRIRVSRGAGVSRCTGCRGVEESVQGGGENQLLVPCLRHAGQCCQARGVVGQADQGLGRPASHSRSVRRLHGGATSSMHTHFHRDPSCCRSLMAP